MNCEIPRNIRNAILASSVELSHAIDLTVTHSFRAADTQCRHSPGEVDKVLSFFIEGLEFLEDEANRILHPRGVALSISAIFTHQTPKVELTTTQHVGSRCELADLCMLATYGQELPRNGLGNGVMLQAKENFQRASDPVQRALYEEEVRFRYSGPADLRDLNPNHRNLPPKREPALAYWILEHWPWHRFPNRMLATTVLWTNQQIGNHPVGIPFSNAIVDFLAANSGWGFRRPAAREIGWNKIIFDLVEFTARAALNRDALGVHRRNLGVRNRMRGMGPLARHLLQNGNAAQRSFVIRNSLGRTLALYSDELGKLGMQLEEADQKWVDEKLRVAEDAAEIGNGGEPPVLGNERLDSEGGGGGAGNLIFFHFSETTK
jgi:hypothetical protein